MNIAQRKCTSGKEASAIGDLLAALPGYDGDQLTHIEHLENEADRARYASRTNVMMRQFPQEGSLVIGRRRRRAILEILETFARQTPVTVDIPGKAWKYLHLVSSRICAKDIHWDCAHGPFIGASNATLSYELGWTKARNNLAELAKWGFAVPQGLEANGKRRMPTADDEGSGWSLGPILLLEEYLTDLADREDMVRRKHKDLPRRIRTSTAAAYRIVRAFEDEAWAQKARKKLQAIAAARLCYARRTVSLEAINVLDRLAEVSARLAARLIAKVDGSISTKLAEKNGTRVPEKRHHQYSPDSVEVSVDGLAKRRSGDVVPTPSAVSHEARSNERLEAHPSPLVGDQEDPFGIERSGFEWSEVPTLFPFIEGLIDIPDRPGLDTLHALARMNQISQGTAARASGRLGTEAAILCVLITAHHLHAGEIRKTADAYMAALVKRAAQDELNIGHTLFGRREAIYGRRETSGSDRVNHIKGLIH